MEKRAKAWEVLRYLRTQDDLPWICVGDYNEALVQKEQIGGKPRCIKQMDEFRDCLEDCGLADMGFSGYPFTWDNKRDGSENIQVGLDRATCSDSFMQMFPATEVQHILTEQHAQQRSCKCSRCRRCSIF